PAPVIEAPAPVVEAPAPVVEAPAPVVEAPKPVAEAPKPKPKLHAAPIPGLPGFSGSSPLSNPPQTGFIPSHRSISKPPRAGSTPPRASKPPRALKLTGLDGAQDD
ncbi:hypothetical protein KKB55_05045, partial [Myxococcota bacterium]|nr:hypothetical protein [Myxococcota bacterium]